MTWQLLLANLVVLSAAFVQASTGIGFAMIAVPLLALIDIAWVPGPSLFVMLFLSLAMVATSHNHIDRQGLKVLFPGLVIGTVAGAFLLDALSPAMFELVFGGIVLAAVLAAVVGLAPVASAALFGIGGTIAGLMGTISGIHGPALAVVYTRARHATTRATIALIFVIASVLSLVSLHLKGHFGEPQFFAGLTLLPGLAAGYLLSHVSRNLVSESLARILMLSIAAASAVILILRNVF